MKKVLANDGIDAIAKQILEEAGFYVIAEKVDQNSLADFINSNGIEVLTVRSATQVRQEIIDKCSGLKVIARGGVGMDNIDVEYARAKGIEVINTPAASSHSVAELVFAHLFGMVRFLYDSNRCMPAVAGKEFEKLKKKYAEGIELKGKTLGVIGFGRIGQNVAQIALGLGMKVAAHDPFVNEAVINIEICGHGKIPVHIRTLPFEEVVRTADFLTLHVPGGNVIGEEQFSLMKKNVGIINASRGGVVNEAALVKALDAGMVAYAGLDVFENEPSPSGVLLSHPRISLTPHIGAATKEAQRRIGEELAEKVISFYKR